MNNSDRICVLGLGYVGLPTAALIATAGRNVLGIDSDGRVLDSLRSGNVRISEPGLRTVVRAAVESGRLSLSDSPEPSDIYMICVPTPVDNGKAELSAVKTAADTVGTLLQNGSLVILESTVPPGTTRHVLAPRLEKASGLSAGSEFMLAYCPERVLPGQALKELVDNDRLIGGINAESIEAASSLYSEFVNGELVACDCLDAEVSKLAENAFRDVNIAFANELARVSEAIGSDVWRVAQLANRHPRVNILRPGPGVGGHCIPVDPWMLIQALPGAKMLNAARETNDSQPAYIAETIKLLLGELDVEVPEIALFGASYKPDIDDVRNAPSAVLARLLQEAGARVRLCDPHVRTFGDESFFDAHKAAAGADMLIFVVAHSAWLTLEPAELAAVVRNRIVYDATGNLDCARWQQAGFVVSSLGRGRAGGSAQRTPSNA